MPTVPLALEPWLNLPFMSINSMNVLIHDFSTQGMSADWVSCMMYNNAADWHHLQRGAAKLLAIQLPLCLGCAQATISSSLSLLRPPYVQHRLHLQLVCTS